MWRGGGARLKIEAPLLPKGGELFHSLALSGGHGSATSHHLEVSFPVVVEELCLQENGLTHVCAVPGMSA